MLDKKKLDSKNKSKNKDEIYAFMRKEASTLIKFKHPYVLSILEPFQVLFSLRYRKIKPQWDL
jgi:hypothetical protein